MLTRAFTTTSFGVYKVTNQINVNTRHFGTMINKIEAATRTHDLRRLIVAH